MSTATTPSPAPAPSAPGSGTPADEKVAATGMVALAFAMGGPIGGVVMALAIGLEQAFGKAGWDQPGWMGGKHPTLSPQEIQQRHDDAVRRAQEYVAEARRQAEARGKEWAEHRRRMREYTEGGSTGQKPERPERRGAGEFLGDFFAASKHWYTLFDDKMAKGNEHVNNFYDKVGEFFRKLWNFVTGFGEGVKRGWEQYQNEQRKGQQSPDGDTDGPTPGPESIPPPDEQAELDPAPENADPAAAGPEPDADQPDGSPQSPPGQGEDRDPIWAGPASTPGPGELNPGPDGPGEGTVEGEPMSTDGAAALPAATVPHMGPQGETNLDLLYKAFHPAPPVLTRIALQVDELRAQALAVNTRVARIAALCAVNGAPVVVYHMMTEAGVLVAALNKGLGDIDTNTEVARELTDEALIGLLPAADDLETVRGEQASGDVLNRAGH